MVLKKATPKRDTFLPHGFYLIRNTGNNFEPIFIEERNYHYFLHLCRKHIGQIGALIAYRLFPNSFELLVEIKALSDIPERYQQRIHQPFANLFNAYCKAINKNYGRSGSLFREHFSRTPLTPVQAAEVRLSMNQNRTYPED